MGQKDKKTNHAMKHALRASGIDKEMGIMSLATGVMKDGRAFWAYLVVKPSKYEEYKERQKAGLPIRLPDYGEILETGWGEEPSDEIKKKMEETYGCDHHFEENFVRQLKELVEEDS